MLEEGLRGLDGRTGFSRKKGATDVLFIIESGNAPARRSKKVSFPVPTNKGLITVSLAFPVIFPDRDALALNQLNLGSMTLPTAPGADYVLFGSVSNIAFRQESMPLAMGTSATANLTLDLVADFSLINTRTYEVKAAFSASGSGQDTKIISRAGDSIVMNRGKVMQETSRSLADNAYHEMMTQLGFGRATVGRNGNGNSGTAGDGGGSQTSGSRYSDPGVDR